MNKPFQFSMRRMFLAVTLLCIGASLVAILRSRYTNDLQQFAAPIGLAAVVGAALGMPFNRAFGGALLFSGIASVLFGLLLFATGPGMVILCRFLTENGIGKNNDGLGMILVSLGILEITGGVHRLKH
jgi:hypothetical protein